MLCDSTVFGSATDGFLVTNEWVCSHEMLSDPRQIRISDIKAVEVAPSHVNVGASRCSARMYLYVFARAARQ